MVTGRGTTPGCSSSAAIKASNSCCRFSKESQKPDRTFLACMSGQHVMLSCCTIPEHDQLQKQDWRQVTRDTFLALQWAKQKDVQVFMSGISCNIQDMHASEAACLPACMPWPKILMYHTYLKECIYALTRPWQIHGSCTGIHLGDLYRIRRRHFPHASARHLC